jgi:Tfp pilus assembly protein PilF
VVAEGKEPALAHLALGNICWVENDPDAALFHFERCVAINPKLSVVLNNLAWLLAHKEKEGGQDLDRALAMANAALQENPAFPRFLDTRGTVLMKLERWNEALADLESALKGAANPADVHDMLAEIYAHLNHPVIAQQHQQLALELRNKVSPVAN